LTALLFLGTVTGFTQKTTLDDVLESQQQDRLREQQKAIDLQLSGTRFASGS